MTISLVKSIKPNFYIDPNTRCEIQAFRPSVVASSEYLNGLIFKGLVKLVAPALKPEATDAEFVTYLKESGGDETLAVQSFLSKYSAEAAEDPEATEQKRLAEEAEKLRLAEEAEKLRLAEEAEQQRLAAEAEAEKQRLAAEAAANASNGSTGDQTTQTGAEGSADASKAPAAAPAASKSKTK